MIIGVVGNTPSVTSNYRLIVYLGIAKLNSSTAINTTLGLAGSMKYFWFSNSAQDNTAWSTIISVNLN
jgi:hypothetical protein